MSGSRDGAAALVTDIVERFHEAHRRDLPALVALVHALPASPEATALGLQLEAFAAALERHMFKEEMRLFPMIEQGGSPLIGALIDDITQEHAEHEAEVAALQALHAALPSPPPETAVRLAERLARFLGELDEHARIEESQLFTPFSAAPRRLRTAP